MSNWKQHHANEAEKALRHPLVQSVMEEFAGNMGFRLEGLPAYGMAKVASAAAQVARAQALGFDPVLLRLSSSEADEEVLRLARIAAERGVPVWTLPEPVE
jgi:hypothetical protein